MTSSTLNRKLWKQVNNMQGQKETLMYVKAIKDSVEQIKKYEVPVWQINYESYGGFKEYLTIRNMYWKISSCYIETDGEYNAFNFPLTGYDEDTTKLLKKFRRDLQTPIRYYA